MKKYLLFILIIGFIPLLHGQLDSIYTFPEVDVQSTYGIKSSQSGKHIIAITKEEIEKLNMNSIDDILRYGSSIEVISRGPLGAQNDLSIQGSSFNQVLVLVDGVRMNDPLTGHFSMYTLANTAEIEQVEILTGSASAYYGTEAIGGIINIITKKSTDDITGSVQLRGGQFGYTQGDGFIAVPVTDHISVTGSISQINADGYEFADSLNRDITAHNHSLGLYYESGRFRFRWRHAYDNRDFNAQYFYTRSAFDRSREYVTRLQESISTQYSFSDHIKAEITGSYIHTTDSFVFNPLFTANAHVTDQVEINARAYIEKNRLSLILGAALLDQSIESNDRGNHDLNRKSAYAIYKYSLGPVAHVTAAIRYDHDAFIGHEWSPELGLALLWDTHHQTRINIARGIRGGDFTERYVGNLLPTPITPGRNIGNPFLRSERSYSFSAGHTYKPSEKTAVGLNIFYRTGSDLIDFALTPGSEIFNPDLVIDTADYFHTRNIASLQTVGASLTLDHKWVLFTTSTLSVNVSATLLSHNNENNTVSKYVTGRANTIISAGLRYELKNLGLRLNGKYKNRDAEFADAIGAELQETYLLLDAAIDYRLIKSLSLGIRINNITNTEYTDVLGAELAPRWVIGQIGYRF